MVRCHFHIVLAVILCLCCGNCERKSRADGRIQIEFWTIDLRLRFSEYVNDLIARYEAQNPSVKIVWVDVPFSAMVRKYTAAAAAGRSPDVVNLSDGFYARFAAMGALADLTDQIPGNADETYLPGALRLCRLDGRLYALPLYLAAPLRFANVQLLAEGGLSPDDLASDYDGLLRQAEQFHARTGRFLFCPMLGHESELPTKMFEEGLNPFRAKSSGRGIESNLTDPRIVAMVGRWVELYRAGAFPREAATSSHGPVIDLYQNGQVALLFTAPNMLERVRDAAPQVFQHTQVGPKVMGKTQRPGMDTMLICVSSQSHHPRQAADFAWFVTNAQNQLAFCRRVSILPSTRASLDDEFFTGAAVAGGDAGDAKILAARALAARYVRAGVNFTPPLATWPQLSAIFQEKMKSALLDRRDVRLTLEEIGQEWNRVLDSALPVNIRTLELSG